MDDFQYVRTLRGAIYGKVALLQHRASGRYYAMKMMSIAHMHAKRAISGPQVREDGDVELRVLRQLSGNYVFAAAVDDGSTVRATCSVHPQWPAEHPRTPRQQQQRSREYNNCINHNHILLLHKDFVDQPTNARCLVFDYCPYGELYDQVQMAPQRSLGLETARSFFQQIACAVRFIHAHNIAHRDISLENILVDEHKQCRLADFGLASDYGAACAGRVGKAFYMAPEVLSCQQDGYYDGLKADIWSLGVLLFIMVTGVPPFETAGDSDARFRVVKSRGVSQLLCIWQMEDRVTDELRDLLTQMLHVDAQERVSIEKVCSHPWLQDSIDAQALLLEGKFAENMVELVAKSSRGDDTKEGRGMDAFRFAEQRHEPQEELEVAHGSSAGMGAASRAHRLRKRMKISIVADASVPTAIENRYLDSVSEGCDASVPPALAHESPWTQDTSSLFFPYATPTAGSRTGGKVTLRSLFTSQSPSSGKQHLNQMTHIDEDEEDKYANHSYGNATRRRRTSLSAACSAFGGVSVAGSPTKGPRCRFCLEQLVDDESKKATSDPGSKSGNALCLCETCYYSMPLTTAMRDSFDGKMGVVVLRKANRDPAHVA